MSTTHIPSAPKPSVPLITKVIELDLSTAEALSAASVRAEGRTLDGTRGAQYYVTRAFRFFVFTEDGNVHLSSLRGVNAWAQRSGQTIDTLGPYDRG